MLIAFYFNPLRPRGRRLLCDFSIRRNILFQPTPPARTETLAALHRPTRMTISTHSAREDGDLATVIKYVGRIAISTHSAREDGDNAFTSMVSSPPIFQPTPPARTETYDCGRKPPPQKFQPTPPARTETYRPGPHTTCIQNFNPLRPRGRRRERTTNCFQS